MEIEFKISSSHTDIFHLAEVDYPHIKAISDLISEYLLNHPEFKSYHKVDFESITVIPSNMGNGYCFNISSEKLNTGSKYHITITKN